MFNLLARKSQLQQTAARVALFSFLAAFLLLAGVVYPPLSGDRTFPSAQEEVVAPETQIPSLIPTSLDSVGEAMDRFPSKTARHFPANDGDQAIPTIRLAGISTHLIPTVQQPQQMAYTGSRFPSILTGT